MVSIKKKGGQDNSGNAGLYDFFKDMIEGNISRMGDMDNELPFMLNELLYVPEEEDHGHDHFGRRCKAEGRVEDNGCP